MLRAAVAAKTPLGVKAKEAMDKVKPSCMESYWGFTVLLCVLSLEMANMILCYNISGRTCFWWLGCWDYRWSDEKTILSERFHSWWFPKNCGPSTEGMTLLEIWVSFVWNIGLMSNRVTRFNALFYVLFIYIFWTCFFFLCSLMRCWINREWKLIRCSILQLTMQSLRSELLVAGYTHPVAEHTTQNLPLLRFLGLMM